MYVIIKLTSDIYELFLTAAYQTHWGCSLPRARLARWWSWLGPFLRTRGWLEVEEVLGSKGGGGGPVRRRGALAPELDLPSEHPPTVQSKLRKASKEIWIIDHEVGGHFILFTIYLITFSAKAVQYHSLSATFMDVMIRVSKLCLYVFVILLVRSSLFITLFNWRKALLFTFSIQLL